MVVAVGVGKNKIVLTALADVDFDVVAVESEDKLIELLMDGEVDAAIRGSLNPKLIMSKLNEKYSELYRVSCIKINNRKFLLAPVGIVEGDSLTQKLQIASLGSEFLKSRGIKPYLAVISTGRPKDDTRSKKIDELILDGNTLTAMIKERSINVKHYYGLIEEAIEDGANFIIASDGIVGNMVFRSMVFAAGAKSYGAITLGMKEIDIDISRSQNIGGFKKALEFANQLSKIKV